MNAIGVIVIIAAIAVVVVAIMFAIKMIRTLSVKQIAVVLILGFIFTVVIYSIGASL